MAEFLEGELKAVGCQVRSVPLGKQTLDGEVIDLPPALLAEIGNDPTKKTILCYGHFDVQPVSYFYPMRAIFYVVYWHYRR